MGRFLLRLSVAGGGGTVSAAIGVQETQSSNASGKPDGNEYWNTTRRLH
jgi:hypothetical protein